MIGVISLLGMQSLQDSLSVRLRKFKVEFLCPDCVNAVTLIQELEQRHIEMDIVLLSNSILRMTNIEELLADVRRISKDIRIVLILGGTRKQYAPTQLNEYKKKHLISDIIFEGKGINLEELTAIMVKGRMTEHEILIHSEIADEQEKIQKDKSCNTIAIFGATHGAGVSSMVVSLAEYFALKGKMVKAVDLTGTASLVFPGGEAIYLSQKRQDLKEVKRTSDLVIYDLGVPLRLTSNGDFRGMSDDCSSDMIYELKCASLKVCMGFLEGWHIKKSEFFWSDDKWKRIIGNDYVFVFDKDPSQLKTKHQNINMYKRNDKELLDSIGNLFLSRGDGD